MPRDTTTAKAKAPDATAVAEFNALRTVIEALQAVSPGARQRIFDAVSTFLDIKAGRRGNGLTGATPDRSGSEPSYPAFSSDHSMSPKEFLVQKQPRSDVERIACLAYYLTHYRDLPHFKTLDLSKLNTEAAQPKFSNAASSANNAVKRGYLVPSTKGQRQLSAAGEVFVEALPDREAARAAMTAVRPQRAARRGATNRTQSSG